MSYTLESVGGLDGVTQEMKPLLEHAQSCYQQCVHLERVIKKEESESDSAQYFPFIVCRKPPRNRSLKESDEHPQAHNPRYIFFRQILGGVVKKIICINFVGILSGKVTPLLLYKEVFFEAVNDNNHWCCGC